VIITGAGGGGVLFERNEGNGGAFGIDAEGGFVVKLKI
jgi:hypothetical protein